MTSEVENPEDLEHANFYLSDDPEAAESLDLLLGTQGWRRFVSGSSAQANVDFREQVIRLLELDGIQATNVQRLDNSNRFSQQWHDYRVAAQAAWQRLLDDARRLMLVILFLWLLAILYHLRRHAGMKVASCLLVTSTSMLIYGCGGVATESMVVESSAPDESAAWEADVDEYVDDMAAAVEIETAAPKSAPRPAAVDAGGGNASG